MLKLLLITILSTNLLSSTLMEPTSFSKDLYKENILDGSYNDDIDHPNKFLDFKIGYLKISLSRVKFLIKMKW